MKRIYDAANNIEAHMLAHMLEQEGIAAHVAGEHLQSGVGDLPAGGLAGVVVDDEDAERARKIIDEWEAQNPAPGDTPTPWAVAGLRGYYIGAILGSVVTGLTVYAIVRGEHLSRYDTDRNHDGILDETVIRDTAGLPLERRANDDYDYTTETVTHYNDGRIASTEIDYNDDYFVDYRASYEQGVLVREEYFHRDSNTVAKRVTWRGVKPDRVELDLDHDGEFETAYGFGLYNEPTTH